MPHTAKFSRRFYEALGDQVVNELVDWLNTVDLTYKSELREANEINLQRVDATIRSEINGLRGEMETGWANLRAEFKENGSNLRADGKGEIAKLREEVKHEIAKLREEVKHEIAKLRAEVKHEIAKLRAEVQDDAARLRAEIKDDIANLRAESTAGIARLSNEIVSTRADMIKWMFVFWASTALIILGLG